MSRRDTIIISGDLLDTPVYEAWGHDYRRHAKLGWLTDALWWILKKLSAVPPHLGRVHQWRFEGTTTKDTVLEAIHAAIDIEAVWRRPDEFAIVMGIDDYMRLMGEDRNNLPPRGFSFEAGPFGYRDERFGLPIHVVTTLTGIAAIPRVLIQKSQTRTALKGDQ